MTRQDIAADLMQRSTKRLIAAVTKGDVLAINHYLRLLRDLDQIRTNTTEVPAQ